MPLKKTIKIGFDLDGVIVGTPPFIPKQFIEYLYRGKVNNHLQYRYPSKFEILVRQLSHNSKLRTPITKNTSLIKLLNKKDNIKLYIISGRWGFLKNQTINWLKHYKLFDVFDDVLINEKDETPHIFKKNQIKKLNIKYYFEDDHLVVSYLNRYFNKAKIDNKIYFVNELVKQIPIILKKY